MEPAMTKQPRIPDPETSKRLLANLRRTHLEMQEFNEELAEINARLAQYISQQRLQRVRRSLDVLEIESQKLPE
jgi:tRNA A37 N6-isopentenylltransferase MiaA